MPDMRRQQNRITKHAMLPPVHLPALLHEKMPSASYSYVQTSGTALAICCVGFLQSFDCWPFGPLQQDILQPAAAEAEGVGVQGFGILRQDGAGRAATQA